MSAIWGSIQRDEIKDKNLGYKMEKTFHKYKIDRYQSMTEDNITLGCGHQHVTKEAVKENLPAKEQDVYYTIDAIVDNRAELIKEFNVDEDVTDGRLLFLAFMRYREKMPEHVLGIFSALFYEKKTDTIWLFTDHTGSRCVHYAIREEGFYFGTTMEPVLAGIGEKTEIDTKWISACICNCSAEIMFFDGLTPFKGVYQLEAGHYLKVQNGIVQKVRYWNPMKDVAKLSISDEEGIKRFQNLFQQCVQDVLRSSEETGITLSSGLDSTSVAAVATGMLKKQDKVLHSFTYVPLPEYEWNRNNYWVANEEQGVRILGENYPEIDMEFVSCPGKNAYRDMERLIPALEVPYKSAVNLVWIDEIYKLAREKNCRIVLKGQYGNSTISSGSILSTFYQLCQKGRYISAWKNVRLFCRKRCIGRKQMLRVIGTTFVNERIKRNIVLNENFSKDKFIKQYGIQKHVKQMARCGGSYMDSDLEHKKFIYSINAFSHLGAFDTKLGLMHGIVVRDPTKDKRMCELCMALPVTCFAGNGLERRLVREGMADYVPDVIRLEEKHRGSQGNDYVLRIQKDWQNIKMDVRETLDNPQVLKYADKQQVAILKEKLKQDVTLDMKREIAQMLVVCALSKFLRRYDV